ncbi:thy-1 membrane glycoprotein-like [Pholidichthys leucotaenia]
MLKTLFLYGVLGVLLILVGSERISVCLEDDDELRVDCRIEQKSNKISSYEFSWTSGAKESLINTNVSGSSAEERFRGRSRVEELEPFGYRMTLSDFTDKLPHNTTFLCKITGELASIHVEKEKLVECSAVSIVLQTSWSWIICLLLFYQTRS